jgi:hypothetical protein
MIITDVNGGKLSLTKTKLREVTGSRVQGKNWSLKLKSLKGWSLKLNGDQVPLYRYDKKWGHRGVFATYIPSRRKIGCRTFDKKNFALIKKAIKELK